MADGTAQQCGRVGSCHIHLARLVFQPGFFLPITYRVLVAFAVDNYRTKRSSPGIATNRGNFKAHSCSMEKKYLLLHYSKNRVAIVVGLIPGRILVNEIELRPSVFGKRTIAGNALLQLRF